MGGESHWIFSSVIVQTFQGAQAALLMSVIPYANNIQLGK